MNKAKKITAIAVSLVMAGTMAVSLAACDPKTPDPGPGPDGPSNTLPYTEGTVVRTAIGYKDDTSAATFSKNSLPLVDKDGKEVNTEIKLPDGKTYQKGALKPIWTAYQDALKVKISDVWPQTGSTLTDCALKGLDNYEIIGAGSVAEIQAQIDANGLLNLAEYMEYLPNLKHFLEQNALAELGTLANARTGAIYYSPYYAGMNDAERFNLFRTDYVSELLDHADLSDVSKNGGTVSFKYQAEIKKTKEEGGRGANETYVGTSASITSYMGQTGSYTVATTDPADTLKTVTVKVDYDAALTAAKNSSSDLGKALTAAGVTNLSSLASGNIVDLQNAAINATGGEVKGEKLLGILREYIKVAYKWQDGSDWKQFYGAKVHNINTKLSDIINSVYAAWDVDIYAAIGRCFVTCGNLLGAYQAQTSDYTNKGASTWLLATRTGKLDRLTRMTAMIGELYGVRGMEGMTYLDSSGTLRQARFNVATWDAFQKFAAFHTEGLVPSFYSAATADLKLKGSAGNQSVYLGDTLFQALSSNDFIHTQATLGGSKEATAPYVTTTDGYEWTGVATPVSRWLTNDTSKVADNGAVTADFDGKLSERPAAKTTVMRFTESALKLKTGGLVVPKTVASDTNRLRATLATLDFIYSNDGQIATTFGEISTTDNLTGNDTDGYTTTNDGWWYGKPATTVNGVNVEGKTMEELAKLGVVVSYDGGKQYTMTEAYQAYALCYKNKLYITGTNGGDYDTGYVYNGVMTPYYTRAVHALVNGKLVNGYKHTGATWSSTNLQNLILGMESHGIVNNASMVQLCAPMALEGFNRISVGFGNGSILTVSQAITSNPWYTCAPSVTLSESASNEINSYKDFTTLFATKAGSALLSNYLFTEVGWYGANASLSSWSLTADATTGTSVATPEGVAALLRKIAPQYESLNNAAWSGLYNYYVNKPAK